MSILCIHLLLLISRRNNSVQLCNFNDWCHQSHVNECYVFNTHNYVLHAHQLEAQMSIHVGRWMSTIRTIYNIVLLKIWKRCLYDADNLTIHISNRLKPAYMGRIYMFTKRSSSPRSGVWKHYHGSVRRRFVLSAQPCSLRQIEFQHFFDGQRHILLR